MRLYLDAAWAIDISAGTMWRVLGQYSKLGIKFVKASTNDNNGAVRRISK